MFSFKKSSQFIIVFTSLYFVALFLYVVERRIGYPLELELIEGSLVNHVLRITEGKSLYISPSFEFTPNLYTPLYYYGSAVLSYLSGVNFFTLRFLSALSSLATMILIGAFVFRESNNKVAACMAGGLYAATYAATGGWMDLARVDAFFVLLLFWACYWMRFAKSYQGIVFSAVLFVLAFYTKQTALIAVAPFVIYSVLEPLKHPHRLLLPFVFFTLLLFSLGIADWLSARWFTYYTIIMPLGHPNNPAYIHEFWQHDLTQVLSISILGSGLLIGSLLAKRNLRDAIFYIFFLLAMCLASYLTRINKGGYYNNLMPMYAALIIAFGVWVGRIMANKPSRVILTALVAMILVQFWLLSYNPYKYIPGHDDWVSSQRLIDSLQQKEGNIYAMDLGNIGHLANKKNFSHSTSYGDIRLSSYRYWAETDLNSYVDQLTINLVEGLGKNNVNTFVSVIESADPAAENIGPYVLKERYPNGPHETGWSENNFWFRSWPKRTMFWRPNTFVYVKAPAN